jgi:hypothetical protein
MGFRALKDDFNEILSLDFDQVEWGNLKKNDLFKKNIKMTCCDSRAIMKTSHLGLQFFSHHAKKNCNFKPESIEHLMLKKYVYEILNNLGYKADIEKNIYINDIQRRPDVLLEINDLKIAFEIQNTKQNLALIKQRSKEYVRNNMIVVWLNLFDCTGYNLSRFNINNDNIFIYDVKKREGNYILQDSLSYSKFDLKDFLQLKIEETLQTTNDINLEENFEQLISYKNNDVYILYNFIIIENIVIIPQEDRIRRYKDEERSLTFFVKLLKGFTFSIESFPVLVEKSNITSGLYIHNQNNSIDYNLKTNNKQNIEIEKKYHILNNAPINEYNIDEYRKYYITKVVEILENIGWAYSIDKIILDKYQIDIFAEHKKNKLAFLTLFYSDPDIEKTVNFSKGKGINVVVLDFEGKYKYESTITIDCSKPKEFNNELEDIMYKFCPF